tara:strand:+ start:4711 stop:4842 length:132 start_codon:yes stop_codon:yes gene_type:complete
MKNGAIGVDEWVSLDGGNAFSLEAYRWGPLEFLYMVGHQQNRK